LTTNALVENMTAEIERVSKNANRASDAARRTEGSAVDGAKSVDEVVLGMDQLRLNVQ
jgi:methyl-accepting chemotaxis protein